MFLVLFVSDRPRSWERYRCGRQWDQLGDDGANDQDVFAESECRRSEITVAHRILYKVSSQFVHQSHRPSDVKST